MIDIKFLTLLNIILVFSFANILIIYAESVNYPFKDVVVYSDTPVRGKYMSYTIKIVDVTRTIDVVVYTNIYVPGYGWSGWKKVLSDKLHSGNSKKIENSYYIKEDADSGTVILWVDIHYTSSKDYSLINGREYYNSYDFLFIVGTLPDKNLDNIINMYNSLQENYTNLKNMYDSIKDEYQELQNKYLQLKINYTYLKINNTVLLKNYNSLQETLNYIQEKYVNITNKYTLLHMNYTTLRDMYKRLQGEKSYLIYFSVIFFIVLIIVSAVFIHENHKLHKRLDECRYTLQHAYIDKK